MNIKKGILYVFFATGIGFIINLITSFLFPKLLSVEAYANVKLYQLYINYVGILHFGFSDGMYLRLGGKKIDDFNKTELISEFNTFKIFQLVINVIIIIIGVALKDLVLIFVAISILPVNIINYLRNMYQATGLYDLYSKFLTTNNIMLFVINMILLFIVKTDNAYIYIVGQVLVYFINWILIESTIRFKFFKKEKGQPRIKFLITDIKDGILLMLGNFCTIVFTSIDRMFTKFLLGIKEFAFYSFAVSVEGLLNVFITPIVITMYNYLCINKNVDQVKKMKNILLVCVTIILTSAFPVKWIINNYIEKYKGTSNLIFILFSAQFFSIIVRTIFNNLYKAQKRQKRYFIIIILVTLVAIILDWLGYIIGKSNEAFAIATFITCIIWFIIGEIDFKEYKYSMIEYIYMTIIIVTYLFAGIYISNAIIGLLFYVVVSITSIYIIMNSELKYIINEIKRFLFKILKNKEVKD